MTNELESMSYFMMVNLQWEHESFSSVEYSKPQFEQTTTSNIYAYAKAMYKTSMNDSSVICIYYISKLFLLTVMYIPVRPSRRESDEDELNE